LIKRFCLFVVFPLLLAAACSKTDPKNQTLTILLPDDILSLEPNRNFETITDAVLFNIYEPLVGFDKDMNLKPMLASSWENPKPDEWRFHLRNNVLFHDGTPLTAGVVREILLGIKKDDTLEAAGFLEPIHEISTPDEQTVAFITRKPYALLTKLPFVYLSKPNSKGDFPKLVGTGAYLLEDSKKGEWIKLRASKNYWGGKTSFEEVTYIPVRDANERFRRLSQSEADIIYAAPPKTQEAASAEINFVARPGLAVLYLSLNIQNSPANPLSDVRVRKALHLALNRQEIVDKVLSGNGIVSTQPVAPSVFGYNPNIGLPEYNPDKAKMLLAESGYQNGFALRLDYNTSRTSTAELVKNHFADIGVSLQMNGLQSEALNEVAKSGTSQLLLIGWDCSSGDASEFYEFCMHTPSNYYGDGNYGFYSNQTIDQIATTNMMITDQRERKSLLQKAASIVMEDLPVLPLYVEDDIYAVRHGIEFAPRADHEIRLIDVKRLTED
jgi:peptide/nickel transport system substrate-binding protein